MDAMVDDVKQPAQNALLESLSLLGEGSSMVQQIFEMIGRSKFYADFTRDDVERLTAFMQVYRASPGQASCIAPSAGQYIAV